MFLLKNLKVSTLSVFRHCETLARQGLAPGARASEPRRATRSICFEYVIFSKIFFKKFRFSSTVKEYLTLGSLFAIFEPWIWRRLGPVPACYIYLVVSSRSSASVGRALGSRGQLTESGQHGRRGQGARGRGYGVLDLCLQQGSDVLRECHGEKGLWVADKLVHVSLACHFLHDSFLVVVAQRPTQFVVVHSRSVLLDAPSTRNLKHNHCDLIQRIHCPGFPTRPIII